MRLKEWDRVIYRHNPLVEVVGQVRFPRIFEIDEQLPLDFQKEVRDRYPIVEIQEPVISVQIGQHADNEGLPTTKKRQPVYHFISEDRTKRISLNSEFIALTYSQYTRWEDFLPELMAAVELSGKQYSISHTTRIGLRYVDLVVREDIQLSGVPWSELIAPSLLGPMLPDTLAEADGFSESDVVGAQSFVSLQLEGSALNLRYGLVQNEQSDGKAFMIDADFFLDEMRKFETNDIRQHFDRFHAKSGSIFRAGIQPKLHEALGPQSVSA